MAVQTQIQTRRGTAASWTSTNPTLAAGEIGFETDTGKFKIGNGSTAWASLAYSAGATAVTYLFNATSGQTTFSGADANGLTLAYTVGAEQVYLNGVLQVRGSDYTATNGTSIVLTSGALTSDVLNVIAYSAMTITDTYTQAQADAKFVQQTNNFFAGKNKIINGDFGIWQRGATSTTAAGWNYFPDRFACYNYGGTFSPSRQTFSPGTAPVAGYEGQYFLRINSSATASTWAYRVEDVRTLAGQTATFSLWAKSNTSNTLKITLAQDFGTGGSSAVTIASEVVIGTLTTSWQRITYTVAIPSIAGKTIGTNNLLYIQFLADTSKDFDAWGFQLEAGSIATPFQTATGTLAGELAACQRYYVRLGGSNADANQRFGVGPAANTTLCSATFKLPVQMRVPVTSIDYSTLQLYDGTAVFAISSAALNAPSTLSPNVNCTVSSGLTGKQFYEVLANNSTSGYIGFSAEL